MLNLNAVFAALVVSIPSLVVLVLFLLSVHKIGPAEVGLVIKRFGTKLPGNDPIAFHGEAGYQSGMLMPGFRFKFCLLYKVEKFPWVQVPAGEIGVVIAQIGQRLPEGVRSAVYKQEFGNFTDLAAFVNGAGQKGVQRPVLSPGSLLPIHPVAFLVITKNRVYGLPVSEEMKKRGALNPESFNLRKDQLDVVRIQPKDGENLGEKLDVVGVVTTLEGKPLSSGYIASRLGGFDDITQLEQQEGTKDTEIIEVLLGDKNHLHNNYQNFQAFLDAGGEMGLQHDVLRYGAYNLNPFLVKVEIVPMLVVRQGEAATSKAYVGLSTQDTSGVDFKFGSLVRPGHRGLWREPLRTGKYAINSRLYQPEIVPTAIIKLDWSENVTGAHNLDSDLKPIVAKSKEGFKFIIDLQVLIHVPDTQAPFVISMVGTMKNLVTEVLQAAVGNLFRDKLGSMEAVKFIETRQMVQEEAFTHIREKLAEYQVETKGVYIQDVIFPEELVTVLTQREIANQQIQTYGMQQRAQEQRIAMEKSKGTADVQTDLARSEVGVTIQKNNADAKAEQARGESEYIRQTGEARGHALQAEGVGKAEGYKAQVEALGQQATTMVNIATAVSEGHVKIVPDTLVMGGGGSAEGVNAAVLGLLASVSGFAGKGLVNGHAPADVPASPAVKQ